VKETSVYIQPAIRSFSSVEELLAAQQEYPSYLLSAEEELEFRDMFAFPRNFVVAEPGYGKTRLLQEIQKRATNEGKNTIFVESKKIRRASVTEFIDVQSESPGTLKSEGFQLKNDENVIVCFDALDEVKLEDFSRTAEKIKTFLQQYSRITAFISLRWHFFQKYRGLLAEPTFRYLRILPFSKEQVHTYLKTNLIPQEDIQRMMSILSFRGRDLVIQTPRYLELLVSYIQGKENKSIGEITKTQLFEFFIYKKLEIEDKNLDTQKRDLIKRVLEKLALIMEIYQTNLLTKDELMSFFDDLKSDLKLSLLQQVPLETFYDKTILKDNIDTIEFDNTEFQEYLAAKEILRLRRNNRTIFELTVDPEVREIHPSWFNTLSFVVDLDISILKPLLDFGQNRGDIISEDEECHRFLTKEDTHRLTTEERKAIFEQVFEHYQRAQHWIDWDITRNLSYYFDESLHTLLKYYADQRRHKTNQTKRFICLGNVAQVLGFLFERGVVHSRERAWWKQKLIEFAEDKNENGVLQRNALFALGKLKDDTIIEKVQSVWRNPDKLIRDAFLSFCREVNPNHDLSIKCFIEGTKQESIYARYGLYGVTQRESVKQLLDAFIYDPVFLHRFLERESIHKDKDGQLIENMRSVWDGDIESELATLIQKAFASKYTYEAEHSEFVKRVALLLKSKNRSYLFTLISQIRRDDNLKKHPIIFESLFSALLEEEQVKRFIEELSQFDHGRQAALRTLQRVKLSDRPDAEKIYEEGRKHLNDEYAEAEERWVKPRDEVSASQRAYRMFQFKLEPEKGKYDSDVFTFYLNNKNELKPRLQAKHKERMKSLVQGSIFDKFDPGAQPLRIISRSAGHTSYEIHPWISTFGDCIKVARDLDIDVTTYRSKIIGYIPYAFDDEELDGVFSLVPNINSSEIKILLSIYRKRTSDLWRFRPDSLIRASRRYMLKEAVPILREFVGLNEFSIHERTQALTTSEFLNPEPVFLKSVFEEYKAIKDGEFKLAEKANELLILNHQNKVAINWRFEEIVKRALPFEKPRSPHAIGEMEHELRDKDFASPLMKLKHQEHENQFLLVLAKSFKMLSKDGHWNYVQYLWDIVCAYFDNRKEGKSYEPLKNLESFVEKHSSVEGINWFRYRLKRLKRSYISFIGKPTSIAECIQKCNLLKDQRYIPVASACDLYEEIKDVIEKDVKHWVEDEGAYRLFHPSEIKVSGRRHDEALIQKTAKSQLAYALSARGFTKADILREPQLLDGKRTDFLIFYGFIGPILIEVKLSKNPDLNRKRNLPMQPSYKNLVRYMKGYAAHFGILLVFDTIKRADGAESWQAHLQRIRDAYERIDNLTVLGLECAPG